MGNLKFLPEPRADEQRIRELAGKFAAAHLRPFNIEDDACSRFRREAFNAAAKAGLTSLLIPRALGGQQESHRSYYACLEELARASVAFSIVCGVTNLVQTAVLNFGNEEQKQSIVPRMASGEWLGGFSLSEPGAGSDAAALRTAARKVPGGYRLDGTKCWCSNGGHADIYLLFARTAPGRNDGISAFLVEKNIVGFRVGKHENKLGMRAKSLTELVFEDCFIPESRRLANEGEGLRIALHQLESGRIAIGAASAGVSWEAIERAWNLASLDEGLKQQFGEYYALLQAVKHLITLAADCKDGGLPLGSLASQVKLLASDLAMRITTDAVSVVGPNGYLREWEVERLMRDAKALQIVEGTNQIQRLLLARHLQGMLA